MNSNDFESKIPIINDTDNSQRESSSNAEPDKFFHFDLIWTMFLNSIPTILGLLTTFAILAINLHFVGLTGDPYMTDAVGIGNSWLTFTVFAVFLGLNTGLVVLSSQAFGAQNYYLVGIYYHRALFGNLLVLCASTVLILLSKEIFIIFDTPTETRILTFEYLTCLLPGLLAFTLYQTTISYLMAQQIFWPQLGMQGFGCILQWLLCDYFVVHLNMDCEGAGFATSITFTVELLLMILYILVWKPAKTTWFWFTVDSFTDILRMLESEVMIGFMVYVEFVAFEVTAFFAFSYPPDRLGGYVLVATIITIVNSVSYGFAGTVTPYVGEAVGRGDKLETTIVFRTTLVLGGTITLATWLLLFFFYGAVIDFFSTNDEIDKTAMKVCFLYLFILPLDFLQVILGAYIRGIGQDIPGSICYAVSFYALGLPIAFILGNLMHYYEAGLIIGIGVAVISMVVGLIIIIVNTDLDQKIDDVLERITDHGSRLSVIRTEGSGENTPTEKRDASFDDF